MNTDIEVKRQLVAKIEILEKELSIERAKQKDYTKFKNSIDEAVKFLTPCIFSARGKLKEHLQDVRKILNYEG